MKKLAKSIVKLPVTDGLKRNGMIKFPIYIVVMMISIATFIAFLQPVDEIRNNNVSEMAEDNEYFIPLQPAASSSRGTRGSTELTGLPTTGEYSYVTIGDVNKDGYLDIVTGSGGYPGKEPGGLYVYLNQDGQSFKDASTGLPGAGKNYFGSVQVIDIDKDSNLDIVAAYEKHWSQGDEHGIGIWLGNGGSGGSMSWTAANSPIETGSFDSAYSADIDNDGKLDLVGASSNGIYAWKGSHSGSALSWSEVRTGLPTSGESTGITLGDVNNDNRLDIVAGSYNSKGISIYICSGSGSISWSDGDMDTNLIQYENSFEMYLTDLNDDSNLDIVAGIRGGVKVYLGNGNSGEKSTWWTDVSDGLPTRDDYYQIAVEDIDGDGKLDIGSNFKIWSNTGDMETPESYSWVQLELGVSLASPKGIAIGDLNNDLYQDIVGCGWGSGVKAYALTSISGDTGGEKLRFLVGGTITDETNGEPLSNVQVTLQPGGYSAITNSHGKYTISVYNGSYTLQCTTSGYSSGSISVQVNGKNVVNDIAMTTTPKDKEKKDDSGGLPFMEVPIMAFAFIIALIIILRTSYRKQK